MSGAKHRGCAAEDVTDDIAASLQERRTLKAADQSGDLDRGQSGGWEMGWSDNREKVRWTPACCTDNANANAAVLVQQQYSS